MFLKFLSRWLTKVKLIFQTQVTPKLHETTIKYKEFLNTIIIKYNVWHICYTTPLTRLKYNAFVTYLFVGIIFFVPFSLFLFTTLQLFGIEYSCIKPLNMCCEFFTNILKSLEDNINNFNNQETTVGFKSENSISNNNNLEANLTNNSKADKEVNGVKELNSEPKNTTSTTNTTSNDDTKKSNPLACLNNKYVIATFIGGLVIGAVWLINPDLPATCFRGLKNLFWGNNGNNGNQPNILDQPLQNVPIVDDTIILNVFNDRLEKLKEFNNAINNPLLRRADNFHQDFLIRLNDGLVNDLADAVNNIQVQREIGGGVLQAAGNPELFNVVNNAVELQNLVPPQVAASLALIIPFSIGIFCSSLSPELRETVTQKLSNINLEKIQLKPNITSIQDLKTYIFKNVQVSNLEIRGFSVKDLKVDNIIYNNFRDKLQFSRFDIAQIDFEALTMHNISFKNLKFDTITFDKLHFDVQAFWTHLSQTELYLSFRNLGYKEVLVILTLGLVISALSSHISTFGVYPSPYYGNEIRSFPEVFRRHDPQYIKTWADYRKLQMFKSNLQRPLTQDDSDLLELVIRTEEVQKPLLLNTYLDEEIMSMENTIRKMERQLRVLHHLNRPLPIRELYAEKIEHIRYVLDELVVQARALRQLRR